MASPITAAKQQLRTLVKQRLTTVSQDSVLSQSRKILETLQDFKPYEEANRLSIFLSMPVGEVQTDAIVRHALNSGKQVFVPYLHKSPLEDPDTPSRVMDMVHLKDIQDYESLKTDRWGIPSVDPATVHNRQCILDGPDVHRSQQSTLDLMLMPGVAFDLDESGTVRRLGHGKGFYDFFLNRYLAKLDTTGKSSEKTMQFYALGLSEQFLTTDDGPIPMGQYDRKLDGLVLGDGQIKESPR